MNVDYDLAIVLGLRFGSHWDLRTDLKNRLDKTIELYKQGKFQTILVSGKWTVWFDWLHVKPPTTEAELMRKYLVDGGVSEKDIILEAHSKDTIGNVYYSKLLLKQRPQFKNILVICAGQHEQRVKFLFGKFFGSPYEISYYPIAATDYRSSGLGAELRLLREQRAFLRDVRSGHDEDIRQDLYSEPYYRRQAEAIEKSTNYR